MQFQTDSKNICELERPTVDFGEIWQLAANFGGFRQTLTVANSGFQGMITQMLKILSNYEIANS
jgi:hypothetical protein